MRAATRGFTLVEMLVTLVVVGLVSTLLWQALAQVAQFETRLADERSLADPDRLRRAWVQQALAGIATGPQGTPVAVQGTSDTLSSLTTMPPWPAAGGLERMQLILAPERRGGQTQMTLTVHRVDSEGADRGGTVGKDAALELWRWPGDEGRFEYLADDGQWLPRWPPTVGAQAAEGGSRLPVAMRLLGPPSGALLVPVLAEPNPIISRRDAREGDDATR